MKHIANEIDLEAELKMVEVRYQVMKFRTVISEEDKVAHLKELMIQREIILNRMKEVSELREIPIIIELPVRKNHFRLFKYFIPSKRREEVLGDLMETRFAMEDEGISRWKIRLMMFWQMLMVIRALRRVRVSDFGKEKNVNKLD